MDNDEFIVGAKNVNKITTNLKHEIIDCVKSFKQHFIDHYDISDFIEVCNIGNVDKLLIRSTLWKIFLKAIPNNRDFFQWVDKVSDDRAIFKTKLQEFNNFKKMSGDPLGGVNHSDNGWNNFFKDNELKKLINLDINRTYQDNELFKTTQIKELLTTILFIWSKDNMQVSYKQGMNEILAVLLLALYPFYHKDTNSSDDKNNIKAKIKQYQKDNDNNCIANELYIFLYKEKELQADLYTIFNEVMNRGISELYKTTFDDPTKKENFALKKKDLFHIQYQDETPMKLENSITDNELLSPLQRRCNRVYKDFLQIIDRELFNYMIKIDIDATIFLVRWLKCILNREFHHATVLLLWDSILSNDLNESLEKSKNEKVQLSNFNMLDFICVSMIIYLREEILRKDQVECLQRLFKYPPIESPNILIKVALSIKNKIYKKFYKIKEKNYHPKTEENTAVNVLTENDSLNKSNNMYHFNTVGNREIIFLDNEPKSRFDEITRLENILSMYYNEFEEYDKKEMIMLINNLKSL